MWNLVGNTLVVRAILRTIGAAAAAGIGWKLGTDAYEAVKKRIKQRRANVDVGSADADSDAVSDGNKQDAPATESAESEHPESEHPE